MTENTKFCKKCSTEKSVVEFSKNKNSNHYTNLQPLWWKDNLEKSAKLDWKKESNTNA